MVKKHNRIVSENNNQIKARKEKLNLHRFKNNGIGFLNNFKPTIVQ